MFPTNAPKHITDPIQDISSRFSGPVFKGVSFDRSNGNASDTQPIAQPNPVIRRFANLIVFIQFNLLDFAFILNYSSSIIPDIEAKYCVFAIANGSLCSVDIIKSGTK